jgi:hypothetical protein
MISRKQSFGWQILLGIGLMAGCATATLAADAITGVARNQTRGGLAAGEEVILFRLDQGMQEEARTKTDSQGAFTFKARYPNALHLVRVVHQGVNYDQRASVGDAVSIDVFDAAANVKGVTGSIEIIRIGTNGNLLHVSDMVEIKNDSSPPLTQAGERTFEIYLPAQAKIDSVLAAGSGKIGVMISALPVPGEPNHYTVNFPLRPGATKFAFNYDLPYDGHAAFREQNEYPLQQVAVMLPPTMKFTSRSAAFQVLTTGNNSYQVEVVNRVKAREEPEFEVSGVGALPALQAQARSPAQPPAQHPTTQPVAVLPNSALSAMDGSQAQASALSAPSSRLQRWVLGSGAVLLLGACGFLFWRRQRLFVTTMTRAVPKTKQDGQVSAAVLGALKEELFQLEVDQLRGTISGEEYASAKQALAGTVARALARSGAGGDTEN